MLKLLSSDFSRLWKNKFFYILFGGTGVYTLWFMIVTSFNAKQLQTRPSLESYYFQFALFIGAICAFFCSMFFGTEYSDGTIRNKVIVGSKRVDIYISRLIVTFFATVIIMCAWLVAALVAVPALGFFQMEIKSVLLLLLISVFTVAAFSSLFTLVSILSVNKASTVVISVVLFFVIFFLSFFLYSALQQPEMITDYTSIEFVDGVMTGSDSRVIPNPIYVGGVKRKVYEFLLDFLPCGQGFQVFLLEVANPLRMILSSFSISVVTTLCGIFAFKKKNLK